MPTSVDVEDVALSEAGSERGLFRGGRGVDQRGEAQRGRHGRGSRSADVGALVVVNVVDDGAGGASLAKGHGLAGLADRLAGVDGTLTVSSPRVGRPG